MLMVMGMGMVMLMFLFPPKFSTEFSTLLSTSSDSCILPVNLARWNTSGCRGVLRTMKLPFVSRSRYRALEDTVAELRRDKEELRDTLERVVRAQTGAPPRKDREASKQRVTIPSEVQKEINGYASSGVRRQLKVEARRAYMDGESWEDILERLQEPAPATWTEGGETVGEMMVAAEDG